MNISGITSVTELVERTTTYYNVEGSGEFPRSMLRRDDSEFVSDADEAAAGEGFVPTVRRVRLRRVGMRSNLFRVREEEWKTFGWRILQAQDTADEPAAEPDAATRKPVGTAAPIATMPHTARATIREYLAAHRELETAVAHAEGEPTPMSGGPKMAALMAASSHYTLAYRALATLAEPDQQ